MMGILCKREKSVAAAALPRAPAMTERIVRPAPAHLCGRLVFICEDLWGAAASARRRLFQAWAWHCPARGPEPPLRPIQYSDKTCPYHQYGSNRARLDPFRPLTLPVAVPVRPGPEPRHDRLRRPARPAGRADRSQRRKPVDNAQLKQSLDQVIQTLENDKTRTELLNRLKQLRDATKQDTQTAQGGILAFIREAAESLEKQLDGPNSPVARWSTLYRQARTEITTGLPAWREWPSLIRDFLIVTAIWAGLALGLRWITRRLARRREAASTPPSRSQPRQLLWMAAVQLAPWAIAFVITLYLSVAMPDSVGQLGALVLAYVLLAGALFSSLSLICLTLLDGPHRTRALDILHRRALPPLWLIGSLAALGDSLHDPEIMSVFGPGVSQFAGLLANVTAALLSALFVLRFRRPITHLIRNQPRASAPRATACRSCCG